MGSATGPAFNDFIFDANTVNGSPIFTIAALLNGVAVAPTVTETASTNGTVTYYGSLSSGLFNQLVITGNFTSLAHFELSGLSAVPLPPAALLFGSGLAGLGLLARRRRKVSA